MNLYVIAANGQATPWMDVGQSADSIPLLVGGTFVGTLALQVANDPSTDAKTDSVTIESYTAAVSKRCVAPLPHFLRLIATAWTSGSAIISFGPGKDANGDLFDIGPQSSEA